MRFKVTSERQGPLAIHELLERHANSLWLPDHLTDEQAAAFVLDHFRKQVDSELAMATVERQETR